MASDDLAIVYFYRQQLKMKSKMNTAATNNDSRSGFEVSGVGQEEAAIDVEELYGV